MLSDPKTDADLRHALIATAHALADAAAPVTLGGFRSAGLHTDNKLDRGFDPVTEADRAAERAMRDELARLRPDDAILGEEYGHKAGTTGLTWVLDPIDGTRGYISGTPTWGTLIAVNGTQGPIFGLIDQPYTGERFVGGFGNAQLLRDQSRIALRTKVNDALGAAILFTTFPEIGTPQDREAFTRVADSCRLVRYGMDCYAYALLAAGQIDLVIEAGLNAYDIAAPIAVIEAAGGVVTNWEGGPVHDGGRAVAAANPALHRAALDLLAAG
ncbi:histidinol-phosphatase [Meridianimarinicoccus roseus]|uniref:Histidinol-phosphatase n=1 Tax=Meridianimarinicoccus roseus TaxID=2072018 RepID=A0A2V2LAP8_9RHOB|nr:histidinol-phosphatase [Meridianimarinicoccus roseus]PWR02315.1 histidinol-phosphatase [Meridianimarinicoccus roseus]